MAWASMAAHDGSSRMNTEVYRNITYVNSQRYFPKLIRKNFIMQQEDDPKHTVTLQCAIVGCFIQTFLSSAFQVEQMNLLLCRPVTIMRYWLFNKFKI